MRWARLAMFVLSALTAQPVWSDVLQSGGAGSSAVHVEERRGPQIFFPDGTDRSTLGGGADYLLHKPSGFACPETFDGLAVLLKEVDPDADSLACDYRAGVYGVDLRWKADDPIRYQIRLLKERRGQAARDIFNDLTARARKEFKIMSDHAPPLPVGPAPAPQFVAFYDTEDTDGNDVQGVWVGQAGAWIIIIRAQYPQSAANDAEAGTVAKVLFDLAGKQVK